MTRGPLWGRSQRGTFLAVTILCPQATFVHSAGYKQGQVSLTPKGRGSHGVEVQGRVMGATVWPVWHATAPHGL